MKLNFIKGLLVVLAMMQVGLVSANEEFWEYTFRPGDSVWSIAQKYTTSANNWTQILDLNKDHLGPDRQIPPGTRIIIPVSLLKNKPTPATVIALSGGAALFRANGDSADIKVGTLLYSGDRVVTASRQSCRIQFADKSELQVLADTEIVLDKLSHHKKSGMVDTRVRLNSGSVDTHVEKQRVDSRYEIRTPAALTAVRGTAFRLSSDASQISRVMVSEGLVGVSADGVEIAVKNGFGLVAEKGKPLQEPVQLLSATTISVNLSSDRSILQLSWLKLEGAQYYRYLLAADEKFNQIDIDKTTENNQVELKGLEPGRYYLRVRGVDQNKLEGADSVRVYEIQPRPVIDDSAARTVLPIGTLLLIQ